MKAIHYFACGLLLIALFNTNQLFSQPGAAMDHKEHKEKANFHQGGSMIPNLTDDQKAKIKDLRVAHFKEVKTFRNQLGELKAKQRTLTTADKADLKAIDANIDEITKVMGAMMKSRAQLHQQIRALLTDEQRLYFDMHGMKEKKYDGKKGSMGFGRWHHEKGEEGNDRPSHDME